MEFEPLHVAIHERFYWKRRFAYRRLSRKENLMIRSIELTPEQWREVENAELPISVKSPKEEFVLVQKETFERMKRIVEVEEVDPSYFECGEDIPEPS